MRTLIFGAGPMGCLYAHLLFQAGKDVTLLARGERQVFIAEHGVHAVDEITDASAISRIPVIDRLSADEDYDLVIVLVRKNKLPAVFDALKICAQVKNILFMGNNASGFDEYLRHLPREKVLFGFPGAGGGMRDHTLYYADRESREAKRHAVTLGEIDGKMRPRTEAVRSLFTSSDVPVDLVADFDGWLKYHVALVSPLGNALLAHDCDNYSLAGERDTIRALLRAVKEGGRVLAALGYTKRQPFRFNLFYWLPEIVNAWAVRRLLTSKFAEVAFARHARAAQDEFKALSDEFRALIERSSVPTPNIDRLEAASIGLWMGRRRRG